MYQENNQKSWSTILKVGTVEFTELQSTCYWKDIRTNGSRKKTLEIPGNEEAQKETRKQGRPQGTPAGTAWLVCGHSCRRCHHLRSCYCEDSGPQNSLIPRFTHWSESQEGTHIGLTELVSLSAAVRRGLQEGLDSMVETDTSEWSLAKMTHSRGKGSHRKETGETL